MIGSLSSPQMCWFKVLLPETMVISADEVLRDGDIEEYCPDA